MEPLLFRTLAGLGGELAALHLLESPKLDLPITEFIGARNIEVEKISWANAARIYQFDPFAHRAKEDCTVAALRALVQD